MHLKTLTLRGFKSFASATRLQLEPGVTAIVGPNGSGKSNVVDALAWVMGEQGAKTLRGGKMEDVIFAGTSSKPALGRAEVSLTIDNTDGALPIDYTEVTISRTLFRNGGSEYAINGTSCRLLDIQELLSDSGLGREMHVIVGQGQLDQVLQASPDDRRGFIEEAAGILKHRRRKERALRKLDAMQGNLTRLEDLTGEIRRQLGPLARQADVARRAQVIQLELRDSKARLLADDLAQLTSTLAADIADETALNQRRSDLEAAVQQTRAQLAELEREAAEHAPLASRASEAYFRLSSLAERLRGTQHLAAERHRLLGSAQPEERENDPDQLDAEAQQLRVEVETLAVEVEEARTLLEVKSAARAEAEKAESDAEREHSARMRALADRREGLARLAGQVAAARSKVEGRTDQITKLRADLEEAVRNEGRAQREFATLETQIAGVEEGEENLDMDHESAIAEQELAREALESLTEQLRAAETDRATWTARRDALELSLTRKDGTGELIDHGSDVLGAMATLLEVEPGWENAIAAALGPAAYAVAVGSAGSAVDAIRMLREDDAGRAGIVIARDADAGPGTLLPEGMTAAYSLVRVKRNLAPAVRVLLNGFVAVEDLAEARTVVEANPALRAVTRRGDLLSAAWAHGGSITAPSVLELQASFDEADGKLEEAQARAERLTFEIAGAKERRAAADRSVAETLERLNESDARMAAVAERLGRLSAAVHQSKGQADRLRDQIEQAETEAQAAQSELDDLNARLDAAQSEETEQQPVSDDEARAELAARASAARAAETETRLVLRTAEERARAADARAEAAQRAADAEREARRLAERRAAERRRRSEVAAAVEAAAKRVAEVVATALVGASTARQDVEAERNHRDRELSRLRGELEKNREDLRELTDAAHRDEMARASQRMQIDLLREKSLEDLGIDPDVLIEEYGPHLMVPAPPPVSGEEEAGAGQPVPYVREEQEKRRRKNERSLAQLGKVNPLALEEFAALEERHKFLSEQLADLKKSRSDLMQVVSDVDARVEEVFSEAFADTAEAFGKVFGILFPGGEGKLIATDPRDMLATGVDIEARPAGKSVKRLSLLSGGERSLIAIAFVIAIFMARPSPFYVMDEVEAALDDANLGRLLDIIRELRRTSQLIIVTHQKRTMEVADALYGVTMRGDGVTQVISQRLNED